MTIDIIKNTFDTTTQYDRSTASLGFKSNYKFTFLDINVHCRHELVATDTVYCGTSVIEDRHNLDQIFVEKNTLLTDVYVMKLDKKFASTLSYKIRQRGAMENLSSDPAQVEISKKVRTCFFRY